MAAPNILPVTAPVCRYHHHDSQPQSLLPQSCRNGGLHSIAQWRVLLHRPIRLLTHQYSEGQNGRLPRDLLQLLQSPSSPKLPDDAAETDRQVSQFPHIYIFYQAFSCRILIQDQTIDDMRHQGCRYIPKRMLMGDFCGITSQLVRLHDVHTVVNGSIKRNGGNTHDTTTAFAVVNSFFPSEDVIQRHHTSLFVNSSANGFKLPLGLWL